MKKSVIGVYNKKGGFFINLTQVPLTNVDELVTNFKRDLSLVPDSQVSSVIDLEFYKLGEFNDVSGALEVQEKEYLIAASEVLKNG